MKSPKIAFVVALFLFTCTGKIHSQCPLLTYPPQITAVNFPDTISTLIDSLELTVKIYVPPSTPSAYNGRLIIIKDGGAFGPSRNLDTVNTILTPGGTSSFSIKFLRSFFTEGSIFSNEKKAIALTFKGLDAPCNSTNYLDPSPEMYQFYVKDCAPFPVITYNNLILSSSVTAQNRWYLNGVKLTSETNDSLYVTQDGKYMLEVYQNGCHSFDTINFEGITYSGNGHMQTAYRADATYTWYQDNVLIPTATSNVYTATSNGIYKVVISYCSLCRKNLRTAGLNTATFYHKVSDIIVSSINKVQQSAIIIYPNPVKDVIYVNNIGDTEIRIFNLSGKQLSFSATGELDISHLPDGTYILGVYSEGSILTYSRIVKIH